MEVCVWWGVGVGGWGGGVNVAQFLFEVLKKMQKYLKYNYLRILNEKEFFQKFHFC